MYRYVEVHGSGFPLVTSDPYETRAEGAVEANRAYRRAVNTGCAAGIRFGLSDEEGRVKGRLVMTKSHRKYPDGPF
jgi:hypothetical protein